MISGYLARDSVLHRLPAGAKLGGLAVLTLLLVPVTSPLVLIGALVVVLCVYLALGRDAVRRLAFLRTLLPLFLIIGVVHALANDWWSATGAVVRIVLMILLADLVTMTTTMQAMMDALAPVMRPLRVFGLDPRRLSLAVALVLRFVPVLLEAWRARGEAWRARTGRRVSFRLVAPFLAEALRMADQVAESLDARGFGRGGPGRGRG